MFTSVCVFLSVVLGAGIGFTIENRLAIGTILMSIGSVGLTIVFNL